MKFPTLYYFLDLKLGTEYLRAVEDLGYSTETMRVVPVISRADLYSMRENGSSDSWLEDYVHGDHGDEQVRIVQAGPYTGDFCAPGPTYSIGIVGDIGLATWTRSQISSLNYFKELWISDPKLQDLLESWEVTCPVEVISPGTVARLFDPTSLA